MSKATGKPLLTMEIRLEHDVVLVRQRARQIAGLLGFEAQDQTRIATAVSEIARNAFQYAGGGKVEFLVDEQAPAAFLIRVGDHGPGIVDLQADPGRALHFADGDGRRPRRRTAADGPFRDRSRGRSGDHGACSGRSCRGAPRP